MTARRSLLANGLWFDDNAEQAVAFYKTVFPEVKVHQTAYYTEEGFEVHKRPAGSVMSINFEICGAQFQGINGGPVFEINPSISYFIMCEDEAEADQFWNGLLEDATVLMAIDQYDWSPRYGWLSDKYGVSWQIYTVKGGEDQVQQKICPSLMFVGEQCGKAEAAVHFYTSIFKDSEIQGILKYPAGTPDEGTVMHSQFKLSGQVFMAMDSAGEHKFQFNEGVSLIVNCTTQDEIDYYWNKLTEGGEVIECGWLRDQFGVSWQVVPVQLDEMMSDPDKEKVARVTKAFLQMKKFDIAELEEAFRG